MALLEIIRDKALNLNKLLIIMVLFSIFGCSLKQYHISSEYPEKGIIGYKLFYVHVPDTVEYYSGLFKDDFGSVDAQSTLDTIISSGVMSSLMKAKLEVPFYIEAIEKGDNTIADSKKHYFQIEDDVKNSGKDFELVIPSKECIPIDVDSIKSAALILTDMSFAEPSYGYIDLFIFSTNFVLWDYTNNKAYAYGNSRGVAGSTAYMSKDDWKEAVIRAINRIIINLNLGAPYVEKRK